jgi:hypothetical protein
VAVGFQVDYDRNQFNRIGEKIRKCKRRPKWILYLRKIAFAHS